MPVITSEGETLLRIEGVNLSFGDKVVLRDVNATVKEILREGGKGQIVGFLGPSGIGKTQLFRIIAGLNQPTSGTVIVDGGKKAAPGLVGVVAQNYPLFDNRTVFSNLMLAATKKRAETKETAEDLVNAYLSEFDLEDRKHAYPVQLSGGQRQRCAILQQVLCGDHFILMDEPFSGLDMLMLEKTAKLIQKVANLDAANTIIFVTHDVTAAASIADHLWMLGRDRDAEGKIIPGARIVETYDLVARDLCWHPDIITDLRFVQFVAEIKQRFRSL